MKNCRNCKWANWQITSNGRRRFGNWAECTYKVVAVIPASRSNLERDLIRRVGVERYDDVPVDCAAWEERGN